MSREAIERRRIAEMKTKHTCQSLYYMAAASPPEFYEIVKQNERFSDPNFPPNDSSLFWADLG